VSARQAERYSRCRFEALGDDAGRRGQLGTEIGALGQPGGSKKKGPKKRGSRHKGVLPNWISHNKTPKDAKTEN